jgi:membrane glycosyltransferase
LETLFSTLHAPVQMLFHTKFVAATLFGFAIRWDPQQRGVGGGVAWRDALRQHCGHTALGIGWGALAYRLDPTSFWWFVPVLAGMVLSIPLSVVSSRKNFGEAFRRAGFFLTPEELAAPEVLARLRLRLQEEERANGSVVANAGLREAVIDPYVNAVHVSLLREKQAEPDSSESFDAPDLVRRLGEQVLVQDPCSLSALEQLAVLSDPHTMSWLHHEAWLRSPAEVADWCRAAIHRFVTPYND